MSASNTPRGWLNLSEAGRYVGLSPDVIKRAIAAGELTAYQKPLTRGHATQGHGRQNQYLKIGVEDLDAWVRTWPTAQLLP